VKSDLPHRTKTHIARRRLLSAEGTLVASVFSSFFLVSGWSSPAVDIDRAGRVPAANSATTHRASDEIVVVLTWDGVRWQEILHGVDEKLALTAARPHFEGRSRAALLPHLDQLVNTDGHLLGTEAAPVSASSPSTLSLPSYSEIFSGRTPTCGDNDCGQTKAATLVDQWRASRPNATLAVVSSWWKIPRVAAKDFSSIDVSAGRLFVRGRKSFCGSVELCTLLDDARHLSPWPGGEEYRPDRATAAIGLAYLRARRPQFAFIGLGDTDEYAHHGNYAGYLDALHEADKTLGAVHQWLLAQQRRGTRTLLIVTADHGRASGFAQHTHTPEAARVWALVWGSGVTARVSPITTKSRLADIAPTIRDFVGLERDTDASAGKSLASRLFENKLGARTDPAMANLSE